MVHNHFKVAYQRMQFIGRNPVRYHIILVIPWSSFIYQDVNAIKYLPTSNYHV